MQLPLMGNTSVHARSAQWLWGGFTALALSVAACGRAAEPAGADAARVLEALAPPVVAPLDIAMNTAQPQLTPAPAGAVLSWLQHVDGQAVLMFAERSGNSWTPPRRAAAGKDWFISWADVPSVTRLSTGALLAQWLENTDASIEAYNLRLSYSTDDGATWARSFLAHQDRTTTQHGFASIVEPPGGGVGLVWLDGRDMELNTTDPEGGSMALRYASFDGAWKPTGDVLVNARVCECCSTAAVVTTDGVLTGFRDRDANETRDIHVSRLAASTWSDAVPVHRDGWTIPGCPVNGPALSARRNRVAAAWFTVTADEGHAFAAFSNDAGRTWSAPVRLDDRQALGRVDVELLDDGSALASWMEYSDLKGGFRVRRVTESGSRSPALDVAQATGSRATGHPRMQRAGGELVFAWTEAGPDGGDAAGQHVRVAIAPLPR